MNNPLTPHDQAALSTNLYLGGLAVAEVRKIMPLGAVNRLDGFDVPITKRKQLGLALKALGGVGRMGLKAWDVIRGADLFGIEHAQRSADIGRWTGVGNCGEQSAAAFMFLSSKRDAWPLEWINCLGRDHQFVLIHRAEAEVGGKPLGVETWGPRAVVCDPWDNEVYPAMEMLTRTRAATAAGYEAYAWVHPRRTPK